MLIVKEPSQHNFIGIPTSMHACMTSVVSKFTLSTDVGVTNQQEITIRLRLQAYIVINYSVHDSIISDYGKHSSIAGLRFTGCDCFLVHHQILLYSIK